MKCPKCQFDNPETQRFCGECGTNLDVTVKVPNGDIKLPTAKK